MCIVISPIPFWKPLLFYFRDTSLQMHVIVVVVVVVVAHSFISIVIMMSPQTVEITPYSWNMEACRNIKLRLYTESRSHYDVTSNRRNSSLFLEYGGVPQYKTPSM
jgi:hypothetical protein